MGPISHPPLDNDVEVEIEGDSEDETQREQQTLRDLVAKGRLLGSNSPIEGVEKIKAEMDEVMGVADLDNVNTAITIARTKGNQHALIIALESKVNLLVSDAFAQNNEVRSESNPGIRFHHICNFPPMSDLPRPLQRAHSFDWLLAYLLSGVLVAVSWLDEAMSHLQTYY